MSESSNNTLEALVGLIRSQLLDVNTAIPGTIVSYAGGVAHVKPIGKKRFADGDVLDFPTIPNVRVCWPSFAGGSAGVKGPVKAGDKCLLVFAQQAVDGSDDRRMFDLQDAYAVMCDLGNVGGDAGANNAMTMYFGSAYIRLTEAGKLEINAPGGTLLDTQALEMNATTAALNASASLAVTTPTTTFSGAVTVSGLFTFVAGMAGSGGGAGGSSISGNLTHSAGNLSSNGKVLHTHIHGGVQPGAGNTGAPV